MVTGESVSQKAAGNGHWATLNKTGSFKFRATRVGKDTFLAQIVKLSKLRVPAPIQRLADQVTRWFVPAVIAIAIATFIIWFNIMGNVTMALITTVGADYRLSVRARFSHTNLNYGGGTGSRKRHFDWVQKVWN